MPFPLSEKELIKTEEALGAMLPDSYRNSMMESNGGEVEASDEIWSLFPIQDQSSKKLISRTCNHILRETKSAQEWTNFLEGAITIGENGSGDYLVIFKEGPKIGPQVFAWYHEDGALVTVAENFTDLKRV